MIDEHKKPKKQEIPEWLVCPYCQSLITLAPKKTDKRGAR